MRNETLMFIVVLLLIAVAFALDVHECKCGPCRLWRGEIKNHGGIEWKR